MLTEIDISSLTYQETGQQHWYDLVRQCRNESVEEQLIQEARLRGNESSLAPYLLMGMLMGWFAQLFEKA